MSTIQVELAYDSPYLADQAESMIATGQVSLRVTFKYDDSVVREMRAMNGSWNGLEKAWYIPFTQENLKKLHDLGAVFSLRLLEVIKLTFPREFSAALLQQVRQDVAH